MGDDETYSSLNKAWKSTCRLILGGEIGDLDGYREWLSEFTAPNLKKKSVISGGDVYSAVPDYPEGSRFVSFDEVDYGKKFEPLGINQVKDLDSIIEALQERILYSGNVILANSRYVEKSSEVQNSFYVLDSNYIYDSKNIAYCSYTRGSETLFGVVFDALCNNLIRTYDTVHQTRNLDAWKCYDSSDCYFSASAESCQDVMFSFNLRNKRYCIGNMVLQKDKYLAIKAKLLSEMRAELISDKRLPSLIEMVSASAQAQDVPADLAKAANQFGPVQTDKNAIEEAFQKTSSIILGKPLQGLDPYKSWLMRYVPDMESGKSRISGQEVFVPDFVPYREFQKDRLITQGEMLRLGEAIRLEPDEIVSFEKIKRSIGKIAFYNPEGRLGETRNLIESPVANQSFNCYHCGVVSNDENAAFSFWPRSSKYVFGCPMVFSSNFCINSYYSLNLSRAFEVDGCSNSSDIYFSHNCENVRDAMFCFNSKNLRNAIGNAAMDQDQYRAIKTALLEQIVNELETKHDLPWSIFSIGAGRVGPKTETNPKQVRRSHLWHQRFTSN